MMTWEDWKLVFIVVGNLIGGGVAVWRVSWIVSSMKRQIEIDFETKLKAEIEKQDRKLIEQDKKLDSEIVSQNAKRQRIYERFDEYKIATESGFVRREMCHLMHNQTATAVERQNVSISNLEKKVDEKFDDMGRRFDELKEIVLKNIKLG